MTDCPVCTGLREWLERAHEGARESRRDAYTTGDDHSYYVYLESADAYLSALQVQADLMKEAAK